MRISDANKSALQTLGTDLGSPVVYWENRPIKCVSNTITETNVLGMGGVEETVTIRLFILLSEFRSAFTADSTTITVDSEVWTVDATGSRRPVTGRTVTFRSTRYRITGTSVSGDGNHITLTLGPSNR